MVAIKGCRQVLGLVSFIKDLDPNFGNLFTFFERPATSEERDNVKEDRFEDSPEEGSLVFREPVRTDFISTVNFCIGRIAQTS